MEFLDDGDTDLLRNVDIYMKFYTASYFKRWEYTSALGNQIFSEQRLVWLSQYIMVTNEVKILRNLLFTPWPTLTPVPQGLPAPYLRYWPLITRTVVWYHGRLLLSQNDIGQVQFWPSLTSHITVWIRILIYPLILFLLQNDRNKRSLATYLLPATCSTSA